MARAQNGTGKGKSKKRIIGIIGGVVADAGHTPSRYSNFAHTYVDGKGSS